MPSKKEIQLNSDLTELLEALEKYRVRYMIIGGHAVGFHVEPRFTKDFDIWISTDTRNALAVFKALAEFGAPLADHVPADFEEENTFYFFGEYPNRIDVLMGPPGPTFESAWPDRVETEIAGKKAIYVGRAALIALKSAAGRPIDKRDLRALKDSDPEVARSTEGPSRPKSAIAVNPAKKKAATKTTKPKKR